MPVWHSSRRPPMGRRTGRARSTSGCPRLWCYVTLGIEPPPSRRSEPLFPGRSSKVTPVEARARSSDDGVSAQARDKVLACRVARQGIAHSVVESCHRRRQISSWTGAAARRRLESSDAPPSSAFCVDPSVGTKLNTGSMVEYELGAPPSVVICVRAKRAGCNRIWCGPLRSYSRLVRVASVEFSLGAGRVGRICA